MAIDIEWQIRPPHKNDSGDKPKLFPRKANVEVVDENLVAKKLAAHSGMSMGVALDVLEDMGAIIAGLRCGKNLNDGPCNCRKELDPRFAALKQLLEK